MTKQGTVDLILLSRQVQWRYRLDQFEDDALKELLAMIDNAQKTVARKVELLAGQLDTFTEEQAYGLLDELSDLTLGVQTQIGNSVTETVSRAGAASFDVQSDILSFGGRVENFSAVTMSAEQVAGILGTVPVGGEVLQGWVNRAFTRELQEKIRREIGAGMLAGEGYGPLVRRIRQGLAMTRESAITLTRTYVQNINVSAAETVYRENADIVEAVEWTAVLEGGSTTGRGTCVRCMALDGQRWPLDKPHPPIPLHPRCRCILVPVTVSWRELGLDVDEVEKAYRPYTIRPDKNIDAGGKRTILEHGFEGGNYESWLETQPRWVQVNALGPRRQELWADGKLEFPDMVDKAGNLRTLKELGVDR